MKPRTTPNTRTQELTLAKFWRTLAAWQKRPQSKMVGPTCRSARTRGSASLPSNHKNPPPSSTPASFIAATIWNSSPSCPTPAIPHSALSIPQLQWPAAFITTATGTPATTSRSCSTRFSAKIICYNTETQIESYNEQNLSEMWTCAGKSKPPWM